ncbi:hypothetical protein CCP4SC76_750012 [Gammaproteobacteria bacterium]
MQIFNYLINKYIYDIGVFFPTGHAGSNDKR